MLHKITERKKRQETRNRDRHCATMVNTELNTDTYDIIKHTDAHGKLHKIHILNKRSVCVFASCMALIALWGALLTAAGLYLLCLWYFCLHARGLESLDLGFVYFIRNWRSLHFVVFKSKNVALSCIQQQTHFRSYQMCKQETLRSLTKTLHSKCQKVEI